MFWLWQIPEPRGVVFDETHFGGFTDWYFGGKYFFDIHPPLAKIVMVGMAKLFNYDPTYCNYEDGDYDERCPYATLRYIAAFWGFLLPPVTYLIARELRCSKLGAAFAASLVIFDVFNVMESRCVLTDSQLMFHCAFALYTGLRWWRSLNAYFVAGQPMPVWRRVGWVLAVGLTCGSCISVKWTALATPGMLAVESFFAVFMLKRSAPLVDMLGVGAVMFCVYSFWFAMHFWMLPYSGQGDNYANVEFQRTLKGNHNYDPEAPFHFFSSMFQLNKDMLFGSASISTPHAWESKYPQWVTNSRGVLYYGGPFGPQPGLWRAMYLIGNPVVVWGCGAMIVVFLLSSMAYLRYRMLHPVHKRVSSALSICAYCFLAWFFNLAPYVLVTRQAFAYHYMPGLFYAQLLTAVYFDAALPRRWRKHGLRLLLVPVVVAFIHFAPWIYALPLTPDGHEARRWLKTWD